MPVIFITDFLIFLLLFGVVAFFFYGRKQEHLAAPWRDVRKRSLAMSSAVILFFFVCIGLFDSIHFHPKIETDKSTEKIYSNEILSVLDILLSDLRLKNEKTYSAPLASYSFSKEMIEQENGKKIRAYPRLIYGGASLNNPESESTADIVKRISLGFLYGLLISAIIINLIIFVLSKLMRASYRTTLHNCLLNKFNTHWLAIFITTLTIIITICITLGNKWRNITL